MSEENFTIRVSKAENGYAIKYYKSNDYDGSTEILEVFLTSQKAIKRAKELVVLGIEGTLFLEAK